ncbi:2-octaprenyl-6-methoxyphenyl hydroxylase [Halioxenophilus sp. WMMB6]|uniref:2-octaprenyl-6-methoxyphenyl hydroxylase n=1 Tax=Halioxenophilus sp. WMMB6 TaxID=3073815 RepID=UPI00295F2109|nr:2-octaprenyl-6-methoxyphenyl hydroxylase [Halioxenophilus sp. WMMB6]
MPASEAQSQASDIAIIGGGMVGLSLAILLAGQLPNHSIRLLETLPFLAAPSSDEPLFQPSFDARSSALAQGSRQLLSAMGVWPSLARHVTEVATVHVSDRGHVGGCRIDHKAYHQPSLGYVVDNSWLGVCLLSAARRLANLTIDAPTSVTALTPVRSGYRLSLQREGERSELHTQLAVIADGAQSALRQRLGIATHTEAYEHTAVIANVAFSQPHNGVAYERFTERGPVAILPRGESAEACEGALIWTLPGELAERRQQQPEDQFLAALTAAFGARLGRFLRVGQRHLYPLQMVVAKEQVRPHLVLMGNAAHALHPVAGQGFNLALRDCARLSEVLAEAVAAGEALGSFTQLQRYLALQTEDQWLTVQFSHQLPKLFSSAELTQAGLRAAGLLLLELIPSAKNILAEQSMGRRGRGFKYLPTGDEHQELSARP